MSKATVSISKEELRNLQQDSERLLTLLDFMKESLLSSPPVKNKKLIVDEFKKVKRHNARFIASLTSALNRSNYFK